MGVIDANQSAMSAVDLGTPVRVEGVGDHEKSCTGVLELQQDFVRSVSEDADCAESEDPASRDGIGLGLLNDGSGLMVWAVERSQSIENRRLVRRNEDCLDESKSWH